MPKPSKHLKPMMKAFQANMGKERTLPPLLEEGEIPDELNDLVIVLDTHLEHAEVRIFHFD